MPGGTKQFDSTFKGKRGADAGVVTIITEDVQAGSKTVTRTTSVRGIVVPISTFGRPAAPNPVSGYVCTRQEGLDRGHIMGLQLGGPNESENIVPMWSAFQQSGLWSKMEREVLARATALAKQNQQTAQLASASSSTPPPKKRLLFIATIVYPITSSWVRSCVPKRIIVSTVQVDESGNELNGTQREEFNDEQMPNQTDELLFIRTVLKADGLTVDDYPDLMLDKGKGAIRKGDEGKIKWNPNGQPYGPLPASALSSAAALEAARTAWNAQTLSSSSSSSSSASNNLVPPPPITGKAPPTGIGANVANRIVFNAQVAANCPAPASTLKRKAAGDNDASEPAAKRRK